MQQVLFLTPGSSTSARGISGQETVCCVGLSSPCSVGFVEAPTALPRDLRQQLLPPAVATKTSASTAKCLGAGRAQTGQKCPLLKATGQFHFPHSLRRSGHLSSSVRGLIVPYLPPPGSSRQEGRVTWFLELKSGISSYRSWDSNLGLTPTLTLVSTRRDFLGANLSARGWGSLTPHLKKTITSLSPRWLPPTPKYL